MRITKQENQARLASEFAAHQADIAKVAADIAAAAAKQSADMMPFWGEKPCESDVRDAKRQRELMIQMAFSLGVVTEERANEMGVRV